MQEIAEHSYLYSQQNDPRKLRWIKYFKRLHDKQARAYDKLLVISDEPDGILVSFPSEYKPFGDHDDFIELVTKW